MSKIKVGNEVKILIDKYEDIGKVGKIINIDGEHCHLVIEGDDFRWFYELKDLELVKKGKPEPKSKPDKFIVSWETKGCGDPQKRFPTLVEASKYARELAQNDDIVVSSIDIVEIKNRWQISSTIRIRQVK